MTCKDCIHYDMCGGFIPSDLDSDVFDYCRKGITDEIPDIEERCDNFKDKSRFVELPFDVYGGVVFLIKDGIVEPCSVEGIHFVRRGNYLRLRPHHQEYWGNQSVYYKVSLHQIGKKVFPTIEEAKEALRKEREK